MISWSGVDRDTFERAVQMLLSRLHDDVQALDGAGGDGGKDSTLTTTDGLTVFQVKSHTGRLSNGQKRNIKASLRAAVANAPGMIRWELIIPLNPTPRRQGTRTSEEAWFDTLQQVAPDVKLIWRGLDWLDQSFAAHRDLIEYVEGPTSTVMDLAGRHNLSQAVLASGIEDVANFTKSLGAQADTLSTYWSADWALQSGTFVSTLRPKVAGAAELDPIHLTPHFAFDLRDPLSAAKREEVLYALDFGANVEVASEHMTGFDIDASPGTRRLLGPNEVPDLLELRAVDEPFDAPQRGILSIHEVGPTAEEEDREVARLAVRFYSRTVGQRGGRISGRDDAGILKITVDLPHPAEHATTVHPYPDRGFTLTTPATLAGFDAADLVPVLNLLRHVRPGHRLKIKVLGARVDCSEFTQVAFERTPTWWQLASDVARLAELNATSYQFPDELDLDEVDTIRLAALMLDGRVQVSDPVWVLSLRSEALADFLAQVPVEIPGGLWASHQDVVLGFGGQRIPYGTWARWAPGPLRIRNREELQAVVAKGLTAGQSIAVEIESLRAEAFWVGREEADRLSRDLAVQGAASGGEA